MTDLEQIARRQLADYDAHRPGTIFADPGFSLTLSEAYQIQILVAEIRESRGESVAGYKVGCISDAVQQQLGIGEPVFGHLFAGEMHRSGEALDVARFDCLAIEGEFALRLGNLAAAFAVIELHNYVFRGPAAGRAAELVANNAMHAGVVLPAVELAADTISVIRNGSLLGSAGRDVLPGGPSTSVAWLAARLKDYGKDLLPRHLILTGSPLPLYPLAPGDHVEVTCGRLPSVAITLSSGRRN